MGKKKSTADEISRRDGTVLVDCVATGVVLCVMVDIMHIEMLIT